MFIEERQQEIIEHIQKHGKILIAEITTKYNISDESARRDLRILEQKGLCKRTHGGAIKLSQIRISSATNRDYGNMPIFPTHKQIVAEAIKLLKPNDVIYLTGGSLGYLMLQYIPKDIHYTIVVNSIDLAQALREWTVADIYVVGGKMRTSGSVVDSIAIEFISRMHFDICFITGAGLSADFGLTNGTDETAAFQRTVIKNSRKRILLMPSVKVGVNAFIKVCEADNFDLVITDWNCNEEHISALEEKSIKVIIAKEKQ